MGNVRTTPVAFALEQTAPAGGWSPASGSSILSGFHPVQNAVVFVERLFGQHKPGGITLREALMRLILVTFVPLALASAVIAWQLWTSQEAAVEDNLKDTATALSLAVDREISGVRGQLEAMAGSRLVDEENWRELHGYLRAIAAGRYGAVVAVVDARGQLMAQSNFDYATPLPNLWDIETQHAEADWQGHRLPLSSQGLTRKTITTGAPAVSGLYLSIVARQPVVGLSVPVLRGEQVRYAMVYSFPTGSLERFLGNTEDSSLRLTLIDRAGVVIASSSASPERIGARVDPRYVGDVRQKKWWIEQRTASDGVPVLSALATSELTGWTVRVSQPLAEALAPAYRATWIWLALFGVVLMLALLGYLGSPNRNGPHGQRTSAPSQTRTAPCRRVRDIHAVRS